MDWVALIVTGGVCLFTGWFFREIHEWLKCNTESEELAAGTDGLQARTVFSTIRGVIEHEDNLINHRFTWLLIIEGILISMAFGGDEKPINSDMHWVSGVGIVLSVLFGFTTIGAASSMRKCKELWMHLLKEFKASPDQQNEIKTLPPIAYETNPIFNYTYIIYGVAFLLIPAFWLLFK